MGYQLLNAGDAGRAAATPLGSADKVLQTLLLFRPGLPVRVTDASIRLGVSRSSAHRLLTALESRGFVRQDAATKTYYIGEELFGFAGALTRDAALETIAFQPLHRLAERLRETVHVAVLSGTKATFVGSVEGLEVFHVSARTGSSFPAHTTACGKVLLAELTLGELRGRYTSEAMLEGGRPRAIRSWSALLNELELVRRNRFATNFEESERNVHELAVPVRDASGRARAGLSLTAPSLRFKRYKIPAYVSELAETAQRISERL